MHPAALPHWRQDALDGLAAHRRKGRAVERDKAALDPESRIGRTLHHRLAARSLGTGYPGCHRQRRGQPGGISPRSVAAHAHRRAAGAQEPDPALEEALPAS